MTMLPNQSSKKISTNPIQDMRFSGLHWIEASAGTGKTYTLSSLMVRIFLDQYYPHQVIATTFTRKATAELKNRVRLRVEETLAFIQRHQELNSVKITAKIQTESDPLFQQVLMVAPNMDADAEEEPSPTITRASALAESHFIRISSSPATSRENSRKLLHAVSSILCKRSATRHDVCFI